METEFSKELADFALLVRTKLIKPFVSCFKPLLSPLQVNVLFVLMRDGPMSMSALADIMILPKQQMTQIIHRLNEIGFVQRQTDEHDKRKIIIMPTQTATDFVTEQIHQYMKRMNVSILSMDKKDLTRMRACMVELIGIFEKLDVE